MSLTTEEGHEVAMTKSVPGLDCLERDDLVQTFCNFLEMAGYVFPTEDEVNEKEVAPQVTPPHDEFQHYLDNYKDFLRKESNKGF
jgi:hypothetical protein